jgi:hypothetical protein
MTWKQQKLNTGSDFLQHWIINHLRYEELERTITIAHSIKLQHEGHFQATDIKKS